jgi:hypothetical protein
VVLTIIIMIPAMMTMISGMILVGMMILDDGSYGDHDPGDDPDR